MEPGDTQSEDCELWAGCSDQQPKGDELLAFDLHSAL